MDGSGGFVVLCRLGTNSTCSVDYQPDVYGRVVHKDEQLEASVIARWNAKLSSNPALFNARKFRFAGFDGCSDGVTLKLGLTDYATFVGTHSVSNPLDTFGSESLALPLGNATITTTSDGFVALLRRSAAVGEGVGRVGFPGGHPEPDHVIDNDVREELWAAARREVIEELFLTESQMPHVNDMQCLGLIARATDAKVCQIFTVQVHATVEQIKSQYSKGRKKDEESDALLFKNPHEMVDAFKSGGVDRMKFMPDHLGALHLWIESRH